MTCSFSDKNADKNRIRVEGHLERYLYNPITTCYIICTFFVFILQLCNAPLFYHMTDRLCFGYIKHQSTRKYRDRMFISSGRPAWRPLEEACDFFIVTKYKKPTGVCLDTVDPHSLPVPTLLIERSSAIVLITGYNKICI